MRVWRLLTGIFIITTALAAFGASGGLATAGVTNDTSFSAAAICLGSQSEAQVSVVNATPGSNFASATIGEPEVEASVNDDVSFSGTSVTFTFSTASLTPGMVYPISVSVDQENIPSSNLPSYFGVQGKWKFFPASCTGGGGPASSPYVAMQGTPDGNGYWLVQANGAITAFGGAQNFGDASTQDVNDIVGMAVTPSGNGYYLLGSDGGVFSYGDAQFYGSTGGQHLNQPAIGMAVTPDGGGYWFVARDGGIFAYGDAQFYGSTGGKPLNKLIVGMAADYQTGGYWLVASDGGIFAFNAPFYGSTGSIVLNKPVVGMAPTPDDQGYYFVATDGGVFSYGDTQFYGSTGSIVLNKPVFGMAVHQQGGKATGYWLAASDGGIFAFGDAPFLGSNG